jgi:hypothetical protein
MVKLKVSDANIDLLETTASLWTVACEVAGGPLFSEPKLLFAVTEFIGEPDTETISAG